MLNDQDNACPFETALAFERAAMALANEQGKFGNLAIRPSEREKFYREMLDSNIALLLRSGHPTLIRAAHTLQSI